MLENSEKNLKNLKIIKKNVGALEIAKNRNFSLKNLKKIQKSRKILGVLGIAKNRNFQLKNTKCRKILEFKYIYIFQHAWQA